MRARILAFWAALLALFVALPAFAQIGDDNLPAELVVERPASPGDTVEVALVFTPVSPEWHGYWENPGDAGFGMTLDWRLPQGWQAAEPQYPVPTTLVISGLMNHIYEGQYAVLVPVTVPANAADETDFPIAVTADYLACTDKVCVPQRAELRATVSLHSDGYEDERFEQWRPQIPAMLDSVGRFALTGDKLRLAIPIPAALDIGAPHLFVANEQLVDYAAGQSFSRDGDLLIAEIPLNQVGDNPVSVEGMLAFGEGGDGVRFTAEPGEVPPLGEIIGQQADGTDVSIWVLLGGALLGGLILNIMPCVFPILSLKALTLARAGESEAQARREGIAYTAGVVVTCVALGALLLVLRAGGEQIGWAFQLQEPGVVVALLVLAAAITANFAGMFELPSVSLTRSGEPASAFSTGLLAAVAATPCTGPFMAAALGAALLLPPAQALLLFAALGLGLALPFLLLGFVPALRKMLPKPGAWMERFRRLMAIPMGLTALALVWLTARLGGQGFALMAMVLLFGILLALAVVGRLQKRGKVAWPAFGLIVAPFLVFAAFALPASIERSSAAPAETVLDTTPFSAQALAQARGANQPVFVWMTADWCVTCKVNESVAIEREAVREAFEAKGVTVLLGDWTRRDAEITRYLTEEGAAGVPLYVWYVPGEDPQTLPQILGPDALTELAEQLP